MKPAPEDIHFSPLLTDLSIAYSNDAGKFIAQKFAPVVGVDKQSGKYTVFSKADFLRDEAQVREDGKETAGIGFGLSRDTYDTENYGVHFDITPRMRANNAGDFDLRVVGMKQVTDKLLLKQERVWAATMFKTGVWTGQADQTGVASTPSTNQLIHWSDTTNGTPLSDITSACDAIEESTGLRPNTLVLGRRVFSKLKLHPNFKDQIKYTSAESITPQILARLLELERVLVAGAVHNTAAEGQSASMSFVHGKHALLAYVNLDPKPKKEMPSAAYTFGWTGLVPGAPAGIAISELPRDPKTKVDRIEGESAWEPKVTGADCGCFFSGIVA
jgi:hypothetical protein